MKLLLYQDLIRETHGAECLQSTRSIAGQLESNWSDTRSQKQLHSIQRRQRAFVGWDM